MRESLLRTGYGVPILKLVGFHTMGGADKPIECE